MTSCARCNRKLKSPESIAAGMGPTCAKKSTKGKNNVERKADYEIIKVAPDAVFLVDLDRGNVSVTNDADRVVAEVHKLHPGKRIFYRDSMGNWDELDHKNGVFTGYLPARARGKVEGLS